MTYVFAVLDDGLYLLVASSPDRRQAEAAARTAKRYVEEESHAIEGVVLDGAHERGARGRHGAREWVLPARIVGLALYRRTPDGIVLDEPVELRGTTLRVLDLEEFARLEARQEEWYTT